MKMNFFDFAMLLEDFSPEDLDKFSSAFLNDVRDTLMEIIDDIVTELEKR